MSNVHTVLIILCRFRLILLFLLIKIKYIYKKVIILRTISSFGTRDTHKLEINKGFTGNEACRFFGVQKKVVIHIIWTLWAECQVLEYCSEWVDSTPALEWRQFKRKQKLTDGIATTVDVSNEMTSIWTFYVIITLQWYFFIRI